MDEIQLIKELRANPPGVRAEGREAARAALLEKIEHVEGSSHRRRAPKWSIHRPGLLATAISALVLAIAVPVLLFGGGETGVQPAAAKVLREVADVAAARPPDARSGPVPLHAIEARLPRIFPAGGPTGGRRIRREFKHVLHTDRAITVPHWWYFVPKERETWVRPDGSGWSRSISGRARFLSARQRATWVRAGSPRLPRAGRVSIQRFRRFPRHTLSLSFIPFSRLARLPTEPQRLRRWIEAHEGRGESLSTAGTTSSGLPPVNSRDAKTFAAIGSLLQQTTAPPALRAALYEVASELPGVQLLGTATDPAGRKGIGVAYDNPQHGERLELIFDPKTSALLGERWILTSSRRSGVAAPAGTVIGYAAHLKSRVVDSASVSAVGR